MSSLDFEVVFLDLTKPSTRPKIKPYKHDRFEQLSYPPPLICFVWNTINLSKPSPLSASQGGSPMLPFRPPCFTIRLSNRSYQAKKVLHGGTVETRNFCFFPSPTLSLSIKGIVARASEVVGEEKREDWLTVLG